MQIPIDPPITVPRSLTASLADVTIQLREANAKIAELEEQLSPKPKDE
jgi:hypothetical protein